MLVEQTGFSPGRTINQGWGKPSGKAQQTDLPAAWKYSTAWRGQGNIALSLADTAVLRLVFQSLHGWGGGSQLVPQQSERGHNSALHQPWPPQPWQGWGGWGAALCWWLWHQAQNAQPENEGRSIQKEKSVREPKATSATTSENSPSWHSGITSGQVLILLHPLSTNCSRSGVHLLRKPSWYHYFYYIIISKPQELSSAFTSQRSTKQNSQMHK